MTWLTLKMLGFVLALVLEGFFTYYVCQRLLLTLARRRRAHTCPLCSARFQDGDVIVMPPAGFVPQRMAHWRCLSQLGREHGVIFRINSAKSVSVEGLDDSTSRRK